MEPEPNWDAALEEVVAHLRRLLQFKTVNPPGDELPLARHLAAVLDAAGIETRLIEVAPSRAAVVARLRGTGNREPLLLLAHTDVVGVEGQQWSADPFAGLVKDGCVYGRGAIDDKGMLAVNLETMLLLRREVVARGRPAARDVVFVATPDEETGGALGVKWLLEHHPNLVRGACALNEGGRVRLHAGRLLFAAVQCAEKVPYRLRLVASGSGGHSMIPRPGNAICRLGRALAAIAAHEEAVQLTPTMRRFFDAVQAIWPDNAQAAAMRDVASRDAARQRAGAAVLGALPGLAALVQNTVTPTTVGGGTSSNVVPGEAWALLDARLLPGEEIGPFVQRLSAAIGDADVRLEAGRRGPDSPASPATSPLFEAIADTARELSPGLAVAPFMSPGMTESALLRVAGIEAYGLLPFPLEQEDEDRMHGPDERLPIESLRFGLRLVYGVARRLASGSEPTAGERSAFYGRGTR